jgi:hypothetical protein
MNSPPSFLAGRAKLRHRSKNFKMERIVSNSWMVNENGMEKGNVWGERPFPIEDLRLKIEDYTAALAAKRPFLTPPPG